MKIAVIGGGAAGMMAALISKERSKANEVVIFEKNSYLGAKVIISGGSRSNVTTGIFDIDEVLKKYPRGSKFLGYAMHEFSPLKVMKFFEEKGVKLKIEDDLRVFPVSNNGKDIVSVFERFFTKNNVKVFLNSNVCNIEKILNKFIIHIASDKKYEFDKIILTTGGQAYRSTGSTGDGYDFAKNLGHKISPLAPSLSSFVLKESFFREIAGLSFEKVSLLIKSSKKYQFSGPIVFTHKGISGPAVFAISALSAFENCSNEIPMKLFVDFLPMENYQKLSAEINKYIEANTNKKFIHILDFILPKSFAVFLVKYLQIENKKASEISKKDLNRAIELIKNFGVNIIGRGVGEELVTAGGVDLKEVDNKTMESKICKGLYFAGEILDIDGFTGGFNLQASWTTGRLAGLIKTSTQN